MSHHTAIRTTAATLGASGMLAMALAAPAMAYRPDPGTGSLQERPGAGGSSNSMEYRGGNLGPATHGQGSSNSVVHLKKRSTAQQAPRRRRLLSSRSVASRTTASSSCRSARASSSEPLSSARERWPPPATATHTSRNRRAAEEAQHGHQRDGV